MPAGGVSPRTAEPGLVSHMDWAEASPPKPSKGSGPAPQRPINHWSPRHWTRGRWLGIAFLVVWSIVGFDTVRRWPTSETAFAEGDWYDTDQLIFFLRGPGKIPLPHKHQSGDTTTLLTDDGFVIRIRHHDSHIAALWHGLSRRPLPGSGIPDDIIWGRFTIEANGPYHQRIRDLLP